MKTITVKFSGSINFNLEDTLFERFSNDDINIELQAGKLKIQSQVRENWIKDLRRGLDLIDNVLDYFESETKDA